MSFTNHRERFQQNKHNVDPNKPPPQYDDCLAILNFRSRKRKDKSRAPGMIKPITPSLPYKAKKEYPHTQMMSWFAVDDSAPPDAYHINAPWNKPQPVPPPIQPIQLIQPPSLKQVNPQSVRFASILLEAVAAAWATADSGSDSDSDSDQDAQPRFGDKTSLSEAPRILVSPTAKEAPAAPPVMVQAVNTNQNRRRSDRKRPATENMPSETQRSSKRAHNSANADDDVATTKVTNGKSTGKKAASLKITNGKPATKKGSATAKEDAPSSKKATPGTNVIKFRGFRAFTGQNTA